MEKIKLFNTLSRKKEEFTPFFGNEVKLYTCGPTVYNYAHIGNLRTYIFEDILRRALEYNGYSVNHVMNITDVGHLTSDADDGEDKLEKGAAAEGKTVWEIADFYTKQFKEDLHELNIKEPNVWIKATEYIPQQIKFIEKLEEKNLTYRTSDGIYFDTSKYSEYPALAKLDIKGQKAGARVEENPEKHTPTDFALWKFSPKNENRQMEWESPWGKGFPGWHLECSAMSIGMLGEKIDIHAGGIDHVPIHHTNERAQNWGLTGGEVVKFWVHGEFLVVDQARMGKSEGNFITLQTLKEKGFHPLEYRFMTLMTHYRQKLNFSWEALQSAAQGLTNLQNQFLELGEEEAEANKKYVKKFENAISDDLNMPAALSIAWDLIKDKNTKSEIKRATLLLFDKVFGLNFSGLQKVEIPQEILELAKKRLDYKKEKNFKEADRIRIEIEQKGFVVEDTLESFTIRPNKNAR